MAKMEAAEERGEKEVEGPQDNEKTGAAAGPGGTGQAPGGGGGGGCCPEERPRNPAYPLLPSYWPFSSLLNQSEGRPYTLSVALPGSILDNAQSPELRTYLAGQIARACTIFCVDEIVVFDEEGQDTKTVEGEFKGVGKKGQACVQLARILQYLECPQYLRKAFFPKHQDLQFAGILNPLDSPHHMRQDEESEFREGVVVDRPTKAGHGSLVNCGMKKEVKIDKKLEPGLRVTVRLNQKQLPPECKTYKGTVVSSQDPRTKAGLYWGYTVRLASCLSAVFAEAPFQDGYDLTIGTSERGSNVASAQLPSFRHALVVFGGLQGLEAGVDADPNLEVSEPSVLFDFYVNTCPNQGSRTIRTEVSRRHRHPVLLVIHPRCFLPRFTYEFMYFCTSEEDIRSHETTGIDGYEPPCRCWELNSGPLEKQPVLLTTETSSEPQPKCLF
ncbi:putative methyltransferase C9orf114 homolog isoform X2 [Peromyscus californicus insignis]|uniref:putative methyltransferase C9orf114 homolog isoform X2 n=1 Tax=Peromyscus californicus insignis TaxID=564181 RepID=UPI0022A6C03F|nr:putative methyltransferase C9orf114 homolog isoform X2 [Peromyscus californicus insignis]XP_052581276.1 putative methyltransferase C9orf114 homolog isoform X2 [Peromyscus californicus insignis]